MTIFGGQVRDLEPLLIEERIPDGWEPRIRSRKGLTIISMNGIVFKVELGIKEKKVPDASTVKTSSENN